MKSVALLVLCVYVSSCFAMNWTPEGVCDLQAKRDALICKLSPPGQFTAHQILLDLQKLGGAAVQPLYVSLAKRFNATFNQIKASPDASKLATYYAFLTKFFF